jgi:hypothetical protein
MTISRALACAVAAAGLLAACVDTSPIDYVAPADSGAGDAGDGGLSPDVAALVPACRQCITAGACASSAAACMNDPRCEKFLQCLIDAYCLNYSLADLANPAACLTSCSAAAGITSQSDPALSSFIPVFVCAQSAGMCGAECDVP